MSQNVNPFVSVIIPVFNDVEALETCLRLLEEQTYPRESYEVIAIDNHSEEDIKAVVDRFEGMVYGYESCPGSYIARNRGISMAKGEIIAFTDSDCIPNPDWIEQGVSYLTKTPNCGLVAGAIETCFNNPDRPTAVELYDKILAFPQKNYLEKTHFGVTANLFTFKRVIEAVGAFDEALKSGGDYEWGQRVHKAGYQQVYGENARLSHPARSSFSQLSKKIGRVVKGQYDLQEKAAYTKQKFVREAIKDLIPPVKFAVGLYQKNKELTHLQKLQVTYIRFLFKYKRAWERMKLLFAI
ncbi:glycosyltransferase family 2 protein [Oscillatoriales cyanobacterium LEGE 11467]|uniref:4,4'-diaponeurosporenoate glycosyltransferase n=1 Tax=Zarconia navalis LEGE 11467 TaxID=1828826 RepID=A0A928VVG2_9CYAN|nr:glycosyltransferase family A protein [Zarconia navalis]MBE9040023.1 glycosyltransferase family 2 protein [Zarconia navalis LEGE 11467]